MLERKTIKTLLREVMPPAAYRLRHRLRRRLQIWGEKGQPWGSRAAYWYDRLYATSAEYQKHYSQSVYYFLWAVVADRIKHANKKSILDLGCGPGQFASLLHDRGIPRYIGLDFSAQSIQMARLRCPGLTFEVTDIGTSNLLETADYDCVVALEFLEHVEDDRAILQRIKPLTHVFASVPNFPDVAHVRHFGDPQAVESRYAPCLSWCRVDTLVADSFGKKFFLLKGVTKSLS